MNMSRHHLSQDDLALFAMQLLEDQELAAAVDHLEVCDECRHEVARIQGDLVGYALAMSEPASPPAAARDRLLKAVAKEKKVVPERHAPPLRRSSTSVPAAAASLPTSAAAVPEFQGERELERLAARARELAAQELAGRQPIAFGKTPTPAPDNGDIGAREPESTARQNVADGDVFLAARGRRMFDIEPREEEEEQAPRSRTAAASLLGWTGWAIAAGMAVMAGLQYRERQTLQNDVNAVTARLAVANDSLDQTQTALRTLTDQGAMQVALHQPVNGAPQPPKPEGHAAYDASRGALVFIGEHLDPLPANKTYELWLLQPDNPDGTHKDPVPAGTFKPDARGVGRVVLPDLPKNLAAIGFGVTVENDGGSPKPTSGIVLAGM